MGLAGWGWLALAGAGWGWLAGAGWGWLGRAGAGWGWLAGWLGLVGWLAGWGCLAGWPRGPGRLLGLRVENERPARFFTHVPDMHFGPPIDVAFSRWNLFFTAGGKQVENGWTSSEMLKFDDF